MCVGCGAVCTLVGSDFENHGFQGCDYSTFYLVLPYTSEVQYDDGETQFWTVSGLQLL